MSSLSDDEAPLSNWDQAGGTMLEDVLESGAIALLDAAFLIRLADSGGVLRRRDKYYIKFSPHMHIRSFSFVPQQARSRAVKVERLHSRTQSLTLKLRPAAP